jgi:predicted GIY-YIG superfamily endonuclease
MGHFVYIMSNIKGWTRAKKVALIENQNPEWKDLAVTWREVFK